MRRTSMLAFVVTAFLAAATPAPAFADESHAFEIAAADASSAMREFGKQAGVEILASGDLLKGKTLQRVSGEYSTEKALEILLADTGLTHRYVGERGVVLVAVEDGGEAGEREDKPTASSDGHGDDGVRVAQADGAREADEDGKSARAEASINSDGSKLEEIVVTAQKRVERLQDVPVPVTAIDTQTLVKGNLLRIQDYYAKVPGLNLTLSGDIGQSSLSIRGLTTGGNVLPTVGIVVDDIPFGPSIYVSNGSFAPDFDPGELARVEVLRGPQGTLYGANSLGGLLKFVTADPSTDRMSGRLQVGTSSVHQSDELGYAVRGAVDVPLSSTFALRASGSTRREPGYIDNLQTGEEDVNTIDSDSVRLAALWQPSDAYTVKLSALYQDTEQAGTADTHRPSPLGPRADLGDLEQSTLMGSGVFGQEMQAYSATVTAKLGSAELVSLTGYNIKGTFNALDTPLAFVTGPTLTRFGVRGFVTKADTEISKFTQELRFTMPITERIEWLMGAFYTHEDSEGHSDWQAINENTGAVAGTWLVVDSDSTYQEYTAFTDFTFQLSDRFDVQVGGRISQNEVATGGAITVGPFNTVIAGLPTEISITPEFKSKDTPFSYLFTPRFRVTPDLMVYARMASGYRPGGPTTSAAAIAAGAPTSYGADTTEAYEIGMKGAAFSRALSFDASLYYIDWKDVQLQVRDPVASTLQYTLNGGKAKSQGVELAVELRPFIGTTLSAWAAYNDAELTDVPPNSTLNARPGNRLPYSARRSANVSIDQAFPLWSDATGYVGASLSYIGDRKGRFFTGTTLQGDFPAYKQFDLHAGAELGLWTLDAFVNNLTDERGVLRGGRDASLSLQYIVTYIQPRTIGLSLTRKFESGR